MDRKTQAPQPQSAAQRVQRVLAALEPYRAECDAELERLAAIESGTSGPFQRADESQPQHFATVAQLEAALRRIDELERKVAEFEAGGNRWTFLGAPPP